MSNGIKEGLGQTMTERRAWLKPAGLNPQPVPAVQSRGIAAGPISQQFQGGGTHGIQPPDPSAIATAIAGAKQAATTLIQYINTHGCDGSPPFKGAVTAMQVSLNNVFQATGGVQGAQLPVDGIYTGQIQQGLTMLAPALGLPFTPCDLSKPQPSPSPPVPAPPTPPAQGMSSTAMIGIGVVVIGVLALGAWAIAADGKKKRKR